MKIVLHKAVEQNIKFVNSLEKWKMYEKEGERKVSMVCIKLFSIWLQRNQIIIDVNKL